MAGGANDPPGAGAAVCARRGIPAVSVDVRGFMGQPPILQPEYRAGSPALGTQSAESTGNSLLGWACGGLPGDGPPTSLPESRRATLLAALGLRRKARGLDDAYQGR